MGFQAVFSCSLNFTLTDMKSFCQTQKIYTLQNYLNIINNFQWIGIISNASSYDLLVYIKHNSFENFFRIGFKLIINYQMHKALILIVFNCIKSN